ncbi:hypothetical protein FHS39_003201 [Streptomyces olivoverticillatus]|uniref:Peptidase inhibitor family I36 n=1 Tax=Streptomyces olivoverticillatus TaxID=66427 RepID=A0A7W7PLE2_9ACTN|nr:peptidase inhibitor family I36 protein [Streptomyces olivoverticillatus]MBB4894167.1 hypothetical protein [Streptomyces olivoverticillatus]
MRLTLLATAALSLAAVVAAPAAHADTAAPQTRLQTWPQTQPQACKKGYFCLFEGPHGTGRVLYAANPHITRTGFKLQEEADIEPSVFPRSVRNPLPDTFGCIVRLNDRPGFAGEEQEVSGFGDHELDGRRVASLTPDCG